MSGRRSQFEGAKEGRTEGFGMATKMSGRIKYMLMVEDDFSSRLFVGMIMFKYRKEGDR